MIVAAGAAERQPEKGGAGGGHAVHHRFHAILLEIDAAFVVAGRVAMEAGGDQLIDGRIGQQVARQSARSTNWSNGMSRLSALMTQSRYFHIWRGASMV